LRQRLCYQLLSPSLYNVALIGGLLIVQVTLLTGAGAGDIITITRMTPADRENLYTNTNFTPSMLNNDFGILTLVDQQNQLVNQLIAPRYNYSAVIAPNSSYPNANIILPLLGPGQVWMMDPSGNYIDAVDFVTPSGGGSIDNWETVSAPNITVAGGDGIVANTPATPLQVVLPATFNVGDEVAILGLGAGGWQLVANAGQTIIFGSTATATAGYIQNDIQNATIFVRGLVANTTWIVELVNSNPSIH
jgi:hypothetical protein